MSRWSTRLRRAASLLLGVHLLQVILLAASAVCDLPGAASAHTAHAAQVTAAAVGSDDQHRAHHAQPEHDHAGRGEPGAELSADQSSQHPSHHTPAQNAACPMAMACTVTAVVAPVPTFVTTEVQVPTLRVPHTASAPLSLRLAPEPPPPRA
jgi:hypothetical protein